MDSPDNNGLEAQAEAEAEREEREPGLRGLLTPAGKSFADRLDKFLQDEKARVNNGAMDLILSRIETMHLKNLDSIKAVNALAASHKRARSTAYFMIMNYVNFLICSGEYCAGKGQLNRDGSHLFAIWRIYARRLVDKGEISQAQYDEEEKKLLEKVATLGRDGGGIIRAVTSVFRKKQKE
ncbi:MAG: hypothetical protein LUE17_11965 [Planctomycetaceae bacterium]|nr:hypothetical protein [Planctomycetaceae bacterium]